MKHSLFRLLLSVLLLSFSVGGYAEDDNTADDDTSTVILVPKDKPGVRMPSRTFIECRYSVGHLSFVIPGDIQFLEVSIRDNEDVLWEGTVTLNNPKTIIPILFSGEYTIVCRTDGNQVFHGTLTY